MSTLRFNKRGISSVISTVLLIAIALVSVGILWQLIAPNLDLSPQLSCADLKINSPINLKDFCYNSQTHQLELIVDRSLNSPEFTSLDFSISSNSNANSIQWVCGLSCGACQLPNAGESKKYFFSVQDISQTNSLTIGANNCALVGQNLQGIKSC